MSAATERNSSAVRKQLRRWLKTSWVCEPQNCKDADAEMVYPHLSEVQVAVQQPEVVKAVRGAAVLESAAAGMTEHCHASI